MPNRFCRTGPAVLFLALGLLAFPLAGRSSPVIQEPLPERAAAWTGDWDAMVRQKKVRMLIATDKMNYFFDGHEMRGLAYEVSLEFEKFIRKKLKRKSASEQVRVMLIPVQRDQIIPYLRQGLGDLAAAGLTVTPERSQEVDFSDPTMRGIREIVVTGPGSPLAERTGDLSGEDLAGSTVWVRKSSSYYQSLRALNETLSVSGRSEVSIREAAEVLEDEDLLEMVRAGLLPATVVDDYKAKFWTLVFKEIRLHPELAVRQNASIAWAFRKNSPQLKGLVNEFIRTRKKGTLYGNILLKRYFENAEWILNPVTAQELGKLQAVMELIKKYAGRYGFDWMLIASQAYQESRLDPRAKNPSGAVGIMQVLPSTARDPKIGISGIEENDPNIHAGVKYLGWLRDEYFNEPALDPLNKTLFVFAAYNAGPAKVRKLRAQAAQRKLDPNQWFGHVESVAAQTIGMETVRYVSSIHKYYLAYKMLFDSRQEKAKVIRSYQESLPRERAVEN